MQFTSFNFGAAVLLALAPSVLAGGAHVINNCGYDVYFASVSQSTHASMAKLPASGYSEVFSGNGRGVSIKLASSPTGKVTQFEFTLDGSKVAYDMSNIDGNPFAAGGMSLVPSMTGDSKFPTCIPVECPAGAAYCSEAYNLPNDVRTLVCNSATDLTLTLCPGGPVKRAENVEEAEALPQRLHGRHFPKAA